MNPVAPKAIDLSSQIPVETAELEILKAGGVESTGWKVTFAGPAHPQTVAWSNDAARKGLRRAQQIEQAQVNGRKFKSEDRDPAEVRRDNVAWVVARIVTWTPVNVFGRDWEAKDATELLIKPEMGWAFTQMVEFLGAETSFMPRSGTI